MSATATGSKRSRAQRSDGLVNLFTGLGNRYRDKRTSGAWEVDDLSQEECEDLWRGNDMAATAIETVPNEMIREGFDLDVQPEPSEDERTDDALSLVMPDEASTELAQSGKEAAEATMAFLDDLNAVQTLLDAMQAARGYGGSAILLGANDGNADLSKELRTDNVQALEWLTVLTPRELVPVFWYTDPRAPRYGEPRVYEIRRETQAKTQTVRDNVRVHESRLIRFDGVVVSRRHLRTGNGWGDSVLVRMNSVLRDFQMGWDGAAHLMTDFAQAVFKVQGLATAAAANDVDTIRTRMELVEMSRSVARAVVIDEGEEFRREQTPISGLPELLDRFCNRLAAAAKMPVTMLMGQAPAGLNATGESDIRWFYDRIAAERERVLRPKVNRLLQVVFRSKTGPTGGREPSNWMVRFKPLWQLTELQHADIRLKQATADKMMVDAGVLMPEEIAKSRWGGDAYCTETKLDGDVRRQYEADASAEAKAEAAQAQAQAKAQAEAAKAVAGAVAARGG